MARLTREQRIEIYHKRKSGVTIPSLSKQYGLNKDKIWYLVKLIDKHGEDVLRRDSNRYYSHELKREMINKVLIGNQSKKISIVRI